MEQSIRNKTRTKKVDVITENEEYMAKLDVLKTVENYIKIDRYDNGWVVEVNGLAENEQWKTTKTVCTTEQEVVDLFREFNSKEIL